MHMYDSYTGGKELIEKGKKNMSSQNDMTATYAPGYSFDDSSRTFYLPQFLALFSFLSNSRPGLGQRREATASTVARASSSQVDSAAHASPCLPIGSAGPVILPGQPGALPRSTSLHLTQPRKSVSDGLWHGPCALALAVHQDHLPCQTVEHEKKQLKKDEEEGDPIRNGSPSLAFYLSWP